MRINLKLLVLPLMLALAGCQTIPLTQPVSDTFSAVTAEKARIRFTEFPVPKDEPGAKLFHFLVLLGGGQVNYPLGASLYDVSSDVRYLGNLGLSGATVLSSNLSDWIEYDVTPGRHTFMLVEAPPQNSIALTGGGALRKVDFIEIDSRPGEVRHIVLTRQGVLFKPHFGEVVINEPDRKFCEGLRGSASNSLASVKSQVGSIEAYMKERGIDAYARDFRLFCFKLAWPKRILTPTEVARKEFAARQTEIEAIRMERYPEWKKEGLQPAPYDLMKSYRPVDAEEANPR
jgi:hypothetical protein